MPTLSLLTLKLISSPVFSPDNFMYVSNWALWMPLISSTAFSSMMSRFSTRISMRYPQSSLTPFYSTGKGCSSLKAIPFKWSSRARHCWCVDSSKPGPKIRWTSMARPITFPVKRSFFISLCALCVLCGEIFTSPYLRMCVLSGWSVTFKPNYLYWNELFLYLSASQSQSSVSNFSTSSFIPSSTEKSAFQPIILFNFWQLIR